MDAPTQHKQLIAPLRAALYDFDATSVRAVLDRLVTLDAPVRFCHPLGEVEGPEQFYDRVFAPLATAWPDFERHDTIVVAGPTPEGAHWVGCAGYYTGTFERPWLDIPQPVMSRICAFTSSTASRKDGSRRCMRCGTFRR